jgi:thiol-disulfide isomerase/thioredoxin
MTKNDWLRFAHRHKTLALCALLALIVGACTKTQTATPEVANTDAAATSTKPAAKKPMNAMLPEEIANSKIESLDGGEFRLADYKGKVVVLDLWATWCGPCRAEIPFLVKISDEYRERGVEVIGVSTDKRTTPKDAPELVRDFAEEFSINYKLAWTNDELDQLIVFGGSSIPQTLVINREGKVVMHHAGFNPARTPQKLREAIEEALAQQS